jgi:hypothetical protein
VIVEKPFGTDLASALSVPAFRADRRSGSTCSTTTATGSRADPPRPGLRHDRQHAQRQGKQVARNVTATLGKGKAEPYKHADLGFLVDLGGLAGAANPLHVPLSGPAANAITRGYHLSAMSGNRMRVLTDWILNGLAPPEATSVNVVSAESVPLDVDKPRPKTRISKLDASGLGQPAVQGGLGSSASPLSLCVPPRLARKPASWAAGHRRSSGRPRILRLVCRRTPK